jgi:hypothetical protein
MIAMVRGLAYNLPLIERGIRQLVDDPEEQAERIGGARAVFQAMQRAGVDKLPKFREKPLWKFW